MSRIRVHRPDMAPSDITPLAMAPRGELPDGARLMIIENRKPNARLLLQDIGERLRAFLPIAEVEVHSKPSAAAPLDADVTRMLAVRSHLVISGLGD